MLLLCKVLGVNRSGFYKWHSRRGKLNNYEINRQVLTGMLKELHLKHKTWGYHRLAQAIREDSGWKFSDNLAHKCCKQAKIYSLVRHYKYRSPGAENIRLPNIVQSKWIAKRPLQIVVSDMTILKTKKGNVEWTLLVDTFNNEIISHAFSARRGDSGTYYKCLADLIRMLPKKQKQTAPTVLHTDQGAVYSSMAFYEAHRYYNIKRSMSRGGTPTDNPIIEALNGWIKDELYVDFGLKTTNNVPGVLNKYVKYFNNKRSAAALGYKTPIQYKTELGF